MKMNQTAMKVAEVFQCCTRKLICFFPSTMDKAAIHDPDKEYEIGDTISCSSCKDVWTLGEDKQWRIE